MKNKNLLISLGFAAFMLLSAWVLKDTEYTRFVVIGLVTLWFIVITVCTKGVNNNDVDKTK